MQLRHFYYYPSTKHSLKVGDVIIITTTNGVMLHKYDNDWLELFPNILCAWRVKALK